jgi:hypothetical protein
LIALEFSAIDLWSFFGMLLKTSLLALACSLAVAQFDDDSQSFGTFYACIGTCADGTRIVPSDQGCRTADTCSMALDTCSSEPLKVTIDTVKFKPEDYSDDQEKARTSCMKYVKDVLNQDNDEDPATEEDQKETGCQCKDIVKFMFEQVIPGSLTQTDGACNAVYAAAQDKVTSTACSKALGTRRRMLKTESFHDTTSPDTLAESVEQKRRLGASNWLKTNFCEAVVDTALAAPGYAFKPLCRSFLQTIKRETSLDIQEIFTNIQNKVDGKLDEFAEIACGSQICTGNSGACQAASSTAAGGMQVLKLIASTFGICSAASLATWTTVAVSIISVTMLSWGLL